MAIELGLEWQGFDLWVTITEHEQDDTLFPTAGVVELDGGTLSDSLQDSFLKHVAGFITKHNDAIFEELFTADDNINRAYVAVHDHLEESREDEKLDRDTEELDRRIDR